MPATIQTEYTDPTTGEKAQVNLRLDLVKYRADILPDGNDNASLAESIMLQVQGPAGTEPYLRFLDGHILDALLGVEGGDSNVTGGATGNGGTPADAKGIDGICGVMSQLERPSIPTNVAAAYTPTTAATQAIAAAVATGGSPDEASISGTYTGGTDVVWTVEIVLGGAYATFTAKVSTPGGDGDVLSTRVFADGVGEGPVDGITVQFDDGGSSVMVAGDTWEITLTAALSEGVLVTWTDSPDVVADFYKVVALTGAAWDTETIVDECDVPGDGGSGALVAKGVAQLNVTSLNATPDDYKFAVYATKATSSTDQLGTYNQSQRSLPSNAIAVV